MAFSRELIPLAKSLARDVRRGDYSRIHGMGYARLAQWGEELLKAFGEDAP